jgi:imidazolonepropionase-like amidohydrolase
MQTTRALSLVLALSASQIAAQDAPLVLAGAQVLDADGTRFVPRDLLLEDGRIAAVAERGAVAGAARVELADLFVIPGLIDLHSHLLLHPYDEAPWDDQVLREALELRTIRATVAARRTLEAGFTTLRDLGTEGAGFADVALRDAIAARMIPGPRLVVVTRALVATGCYGPSGFDPRWEVPSGALVADGADGVRVAVRQQIAAGADWIKVYADYRRRAGDPATPTFSGAELAAIVDEARSAGLHVAAHATTDAAIARAVRAGVRTIEHGTGASAETLALMRERGVALCPTLAASEAIARYAGWRPGQPHRQPEPERLREARALIERALAAGVVIANGSDVGVFAHGDNARELELLVACGMSAGDALRAATKVAADVLDRDDLGRIAEGCVADLVALRGDPLVDIAATRAVAVVVQNGRVVVDRH